MHTHSNEDSAERFPYLDPCLTVLWNQWSLQSGFCHLLNWIKRMCNVPGMCIFYGLYEQTMLKFQLYISKSVFNFTCCIAKIRAYTTRDIFWCIKIIGVQSVVHQIWIHTTFVKYCTLKNRFLENVSFKSVVLSEYKQLFSCETTIISEYIVAQTWQTLQEIGGFPTATITIDSKQRKNDRIY